MSAPTKSSRRVRIGLFEVDLASGQVMREGLRLPLQDQPFRVLSLLLEHPSQIVTREELQARLWPVDTYVGFDEGLNTAIRKLRVLFGDSADNPRFIETIPRRGYRFIAPVTELPGTEIPEAIDPVNSSNATAEANAKPENGEPPVSLGPASLADNGRAGLAEPPVPRAARAHLTRWAIVAAAAAVLIIASVAAIRHIRSRASVQAHGVKRGMLAVLPFQNLSGDPAQDYFSDGLTEETITDLGQLSPSQMGVIARTSAMAYKHTDKTIGQIGHELGVDYVLEGSVRRDSGRVRISAQLIRVSDQTHLWAQNYDARDLNDLIDVQNAIGRAIADEVQLNVASEHPAHEAKQRPINPEAYDLYLRGRFYWNQRTPGSVRESIEFFKKATAADPGFAQAYAGLADAYNFSNIVGLYSAKDSFPQARAAAMKAIELDPSLAEAHAALGMEKSHYEFDMPGAREEFIKAIELNPSSAYAHLFYSNCYLMPMRRSAEAIAENKKAIELDPLSLPINNFLAVSYLNAGDPSASYQQFQRVIAMDPNFPLSHEYLAGLLEQIGRYEESIDEREKSDILNGSSQKDAAERAALALNALKKGGASAYWNVRLAQDMKWMREAGAGFYAFIPAMDLAMANRKDEAFAWLEKAYAAREGQELTLLAVDPVWNNLHGDPRFSDLLRRIGLPEVDRSGR